jgi:hypothetical protein
LQGGQIGDDLLDAARTSAHANSEYRKRKHPLAKADNVAAIALANKIARTGQ